MSESKVFVYSTSARFGSEAVPQEDLERLAVLLKAKVSMPTMGNLRQLKVLGAELRRRAED